MEHERMPLCRGLIEGDQDLRATFDKDDVLPAREVSARSSPIDGKDAKRGTMDMEGMRHIG